MLDDVKILIVDDEEIMRESLKCWLEEDGYSVVTAAGGLAAIDMLAADRPNLVILDLKMPGMDGMEALRRIRKIDPKLPVIMVTAYASIETAIETMKEGAYDYLIKPFNPDETLMLIRKIVSQQRLVKENIYLREKLRKSYRFENILGKNHRMLEIFETIKIVAPTKATILIQGATGTGKELIARAVHKQSSRASGPFVAISCAALTDSLLESELFGYEKGAFTDAKSSRMGKIELAAGGTLFLDEIGDISTKLQLDLLRVLQEKEVTRVGGSHAKKLDVRFIAATNKDLGRLVDEGTFRDDLYYRLNVVVLNIPPLKERQDDIPILAEHFVKKSAMETGKDVTEIDAEVLKLFMEYEWPGNVRELESICERAVILAKSNRITEAEIPRPISARDKQGRFKPTDLLSLGEIERKHILEVLSRNNWNIMKSCKVLGINRVTLYNKIKKYGLKK